MQYGKQATRIPNSSLDIVVKAKGIAALAASTVPSMSLLLTLCLLIKCRSHAFQLFGLKVQRLHRKDRKVVSAVYGQSQTIENKRT